MLSDLHLHSTASDGTLSPADLVNFAVSRNINILALTDHDTTQGISQAQVAVNNFNKCLPDNKKIRFIPGIELSTHIQHMDMSFDAHILGYNIDCNNPLLNDTIIEMKTKRAKKLDLRLDYLKNHHNIILPDDKIACLRKANSVCKINLAKAVFELGYASDIQDAIKKYLSIKFPNMLIEYHQGINAIIASGGIPIYAHPLGGEGTVHLSKEQVEKRIDILVDSGVMGIECYYSRYTPYECQMLVEIANKKGLLISGGSDFHGENKTVEIAHLNTDNLPVDASSLTVLNKLLY